PVLLRGPSGPHERARAAAIVEAHGRSSLARLALLDDKSFYFSPGGSVVSFVVKARVGLALGDPIGPAEDAAAAIRGFAGLCARNDWRPAFYQVMPGMLDAYHAAGLDSLCVGHEAIVDLAGWSLEGRPMKPLRGAVHRLERAGARVEVHEPPLADELVDELRDVSEEWLATMRGSEKRFSLGWFDEPYIRSGPVATVVSAAGAVRAFANLVTEYRLDELTADLMRYRRNVESGTMDYLFAGLFRWAQTRGYATFNLGLSPLAGIGEHPGSPAFERALRFIFEHMNRFYSFQGVHAFKEKFQPRWEPRYLIHSSAASLPAVALALILADSGASTLWPRRWTRERAGGTGRAFDTPYPSAHANAARPCSGPIEAPEGSAADGAGDPSAERG
ncbi:MAG TPA: phosphatidylglycerol lysyltransferase domain-containing protein, partial [Terriglobales bacterium]|nr:phosphatidylglycerol lysyltransferase domain-containing protein [Terriglobales bacterium]